MIICFPFPFLRVISEVPENGIDIFREAAQALIEEKGAEEAVAAALAYITGASELPRRSLITTQEVSRIHTRRVCKPHTKSIVTIK